MIYYKSESLPVQTSIHHQSFSIQKDDSLIGILWKGSKKNGTMDRQQCVCMCVCY